MTTKISGTLILRNNIVKKLTGTLTLRNTIQSLTKLTGTLTLKNRIEGGTSGVSAGGFYFDKGHTG